MVSRSSLEGAEEEYKDRGYRYVRVCEKMMLFVQSESSGFSEHGLEGNVQK
jgi:hypothetical protein